MTEAYQVQRIADVGRVIVLRSADGAVIPRDPSNGDFAEFLQWNAKQETPLDYSDLPPPEPPPPLKPAATLQEMFLAAPAEARQAFWDLCVGDMLLEWAAANPDRAAKHAKTCGFNVDLREAK